MRHSSFSKSGPANRGRASRSRADRGLSKLIAVAMAVAAGISLAACGAGDVELNGKIFEAMGVSGTGAKAAEPKIAARNGLIVPPNTGSLPPPGSGPEPASAADLALINDPDRKKTMDRAQLQREQAEFCRANYELPKARGDDSVDGVVGPAGPCRPSFLSAVKNWTGGNDEDPDSE